jgi:uncharacterized membrane protein
MLVVFPIGLWVFSVLCDLLFVATNAPAWNTTACYALGGGVIGAAVAAFPGMIDGLFLRKSPIFRTVILHVALNLFALLAFSMSLLSRLIEAPFSWSLALSAIGLLPLALGGWYGGELVFVHAVGVEPEAERHQARTERRHATPSGGEPEPSRVILRRRRRSGGPLAFVSVRWLRRLDRWAAKGGGSSVGNPWR